MAVSKVDSPTVETLSPVHFKAPLEAPVQVSKAPLGLAAVGSSIKAADTPPPERTLFSPPKVVDYMCIELAEDFSSAIRDVIDLISKTLRAIHDELKISMEEKTELLKNLLARAKEASMSSYYQNMASYALTAFNFALGAFLMNSEAAEAAVPAMCFMAAAGLSATGLVMKETSGWHFIAQLCSGGDEEMEERIKEYAPLVLIGLSTSLTLAGGSISALDSSLFEGLAISKETAETLESGVAFSSNASTAANAVTQSREGFARAGLAAIKDRISSSSFVQEGLTNFVSDIKGVLDTCYSTLKQIIQNTISRSVT